MIACNVDTPHKRAVLEAIAEEATETELSMPLSYRSRLVCARCQDAVQILMRPGWIYPKYNWNSWWHTIRLTMKYRVISRVRDAYGVLVGKINLFPGRIHPSISVPDIEPSDIDRRREYNFFVQSIVDRKTK